MRALDQHLVALLAAVLLVSLLGAAVMAAAQRIPPPVPPLPGPSPRELATRPQQAPRPAAVVTAIVQGRVGPRVLSIESTLAAANQQVQAYCGTAALPDCAPQDATDGSGPPAPAALVLAQAALVLLVDSHDLTAWPAPALDALPGRHMERLLADLALVCEQLSRLLQETAAAVGSTASLQMTRGTVGRPLVGYGARVASAVAILRRAEGWLETIDHETGAHATLPGFEPGPSLEKRLNLP
jgi:hypothetical protein